MSSIKVIHYHRLDMWTFSKNDSDFEKQEYLPIKTKGEYLSEVVRDHLNDQKCYRILDDSNSPLSSDVAILEIITVNENYIFGKLGKERDIEHYQIREKETLKARKISKGPNELFECYSYFLISKSDLTLSYIREQSAPNIRYIKLLIDNIFSKDKVFGEIVTLIDQDAVEKLSGKDIIGSISYNMTYKDGMKNLVTGLTEKEYELLQNQKGVKITVDLKAKKRKKSVFDSKDNARKFFSILRKLKISANVKAKNKDDKYMQSFKLENNPFCRKESFEVTDDDISFENMIERKLWTKYQQNKYEISMYI